MPGGFVRIAEDVDARAVNLQHGAATADAWVLSDRPVVETTLLPTPERITIQRAAGVLPSRAADNLFWVGRYVERAEATLAAGARPDPPRHRARRGGGAGDRAHHRSAGRPGARARTTFRMPRRC